MRRSVGGSAGRDVTVQWFSINNKSINHKPIQWVNSGIHCCAHSHYYHFRIVSQVALTLTRRGTDPWIRVWTSYYAYALKKIAWLKKIPTKKTTTKQQVEMKNGILRKLRQLRLFLTCLTLFIRFLPSLNVFLSVSGHRDNSEDLKGKWFAPWAHLKNVNRLKKKGVHFFGPYSPTPRHPHPPHTCTYSYKEVYGVGLTTGQCLKLVWCGWWGSERERENEKREICEG